MSSKEIVVPEWKIAEVNKLVNLIKENKVIGIADLRKVRAIQLQQLRKKLKGEVEIRVTKKSLVKRALEKCKGFKENIEQLIEQLAGPCVFLFTDMNPFKLSLLLQKNKIRVGAKAGDIASEDIIVPAGNTGLPPGPIISELHGVKIPTRIESGSVWIIRDSVVAKKGDVISPRLASVLSRLGVKPLEVSLKMKSAYNDGMILKEDELYVDLDAIRRRIQEAHTLAINLAVNAPYPTITTMEATLKRALLEARSLAINAAYMSHSTASDLLRIGYVQMLSLLNILSKVEAQHKGKVEKGEPQEKKKETGGKNG